MQAGLENEKPEKKEIYAEFIKLIYQLGCEALDEGQPEARDPFQLMKGTVARVELAFKLGRKVPKVKKRKLKK